jgi:hypothetical protein
MMPTDEGKTCIFYWEFGKETLKTIIAEFEIPLYIIQKLENQNRVYEHEYRNNYSIAQALTKRETSTPKALKLIKITGIFNPDGENVLHPGISVSWKSLNNKTIPDLPPGIPVDLDISLNEQSLVSGEYGIVWATWDQRQAEVLSNALLARNIATVIGKIELEEGNLLLIKIDNNKDIGEAMDYIWRKEGGLKLKPDWTYPDGEPNRSFEKWLNG